MLFGEIMSNLCWLGSDQITFLGYSHFPDCTFSHEKSRGDQIDLFTDLFQKYTILELTRSSDRPITIDGPMERLAGAFKSRSLAGIFETGGFETYWGRCLLWTRADDVTSTKKILPGLDTRKNPTTWS